MAVSPFSLSVDIEKFNREMQAYYKKYTKKTVQKGLKKVMYAVLAEIMKRHPVDTGRSRAGWYAATDKLALSISRTGTKEESEGERQSKYTEKLTGTRQYIEVCNRVHYTTYLEFGTSKMSPRSMVRKSLDLVGRKVGEKFK